MYKIFIECNFVKAATNLVSLAENTYTFEINHTKNNKKS